jgi:hypothetical protein
MGIQFLPIAGLPKETDQAKATTPALGACSLATFLAIVGRCLHRCKSCGDRDAPLDSLLLACASRRTDSSSRPVAALEGRRYNGPPKMVDATSDRRARIRDHLRLNVYGTQLHHRFF